MQRSVLGVDKVKAKVVFDVSYNVSFFFANTFTHVDKSNSRCVKPIVGRFSIWAQALEEVLM